MIRQYITKYNPETKTKQYCGVIIAEKDENGQVNIGWSMLHKKDREETEEYNKKVKRANAESWRLLGQGDCDAADKIKDYRPKFDKYEAVKVAREKMSSAIKMKTLPKKVKKAIMPFIQKRVIPYFQDGKGVVVEN